MLNLSKECINSILENSKESDFLFDDSISSITNDDLKKMYDSCCPISGEVCEAMKEAMANPKNVRVVLGNDKSVYVEASEFANFCEASGLDLREAAEAILKEAEGEAGVDLDIDEFHVVFSPSDTLQKNLTMSLGSGMKLGYDAKDNWANKLLTGIKTYGLNANIGVEPSDDDTETLEV